MTPDTVGKLAQEVRFLADLMETRRSILLLVEGPFDPEDDDEIMISYGDYAVVDYTREDVVPIIKTAIEGLDKAIKEHKLHLAEKDVTIPEGWPFPKNGEDEK